jgi:hypothetical protein
MPPRKPPAIPAADPAAVVGAGAGRRRNGGESRRSDGEG